MNKPLPPHLEKYRSVQNYEKYTPVDQAVWRYCLRQLTDFLSRHGHECYLEGLEKTGISTERIPLISDMSNCLEKFGWTAIPVSGFIPPAAFMELQSLGILPIACDMRSIDHLLYTPAPDIVHEAAGHAPIIVNEEYADYLRKYSQVAKKAIISKEDIDLYEAIRDLSDIKENPQSTSSDIDKAEKKLQQTIQNISHTSEASQLSRMNWWTAEYGLIGDLKNPKIFGAGLLSSVGESKWCLSEKVKKIPLTVDCIQQSYDITEPQPQLYVTPDFKTLVNVLNEFSETMAYKTAGVNALEKILKAESVNTVELDSGAQISGKLEKYLSNEQKIIFLKFSGPTQLAFNDQEIKNHGKNYHTDGYSTPLGSFTLIKNEFTQETIFKYDSGFEIKGRLVQTIELSKDLKISTFNQVTMTYKNEIFFKPEWGNLDIITGQKITSVYGGPADRISYGVMDDFIAAKVPSAIYSDQQKNIFSLYQKVRDLRESKKIELARIQEIYKYALDTAKNEWLLFLELFELAYSIKSSNSEEIRLHLDQIAQEKQNLKNVIHDGLKRVYA